MTSDLLLVALDMQQEELREWLRNLTIDEQVAMSLECMERSKQRRKLNDSRAVFKWETTT